MKCGRCMKELNECLCEDIEERLKREANDGVTYKYCKKCDQHWQRCKCEKPEWGLKGMGPMNN